MRLLACDFDGTVYRRHTIDGLDIAAVKAFRAAGNVFGIVTGRGAMTLMRELVRHPLECDFLLCNNGALLMDGQGRYVAERPLAPEVSQLLLRHRVTETADATAVFDGLEMHVLEGGGHWVNPVYDPPFMARSQALQKRFLQISFGFCDRAQAFDWGDRLAGELGDRARVQCSISVADVTAPEVGKASGVAWACERNHWEPEDVTTCGDDGNDVDMLKTYDGWAMEDADESVRAAAKGTVSSIAELISTRYGIV